MFNGDIFIGQVVSEVLDQFLSEVGSVLGRTNKVKFCLTYKICGEGSDRSNYKDVNILGYLHPPLLFKLTGILGFLDPHISKREKRFKTFQKILSSLQTSACLSDCIVLCCYISRS